MLRSQRLRLSDMRAISRLVGDVRDLRNDPQSQRRRLVDGAAELLGASYGGAVTFSRFLSGQRPIVTSYVPISLEDARMAKYADEWGRTHDVLEDPMVDLVRPLGDPIAVTARSPLISDDHWVNYAIYEALMEPCAVRDILVGFFRMPEDAGSILGVTLHRRGRDRIYAARDRRIMKLLISELYALHCDGRLEAAPDLLELHARVRSLPRRQREVLDHLLAGETAKQIADTLSLSPRTVEDYIRTLLRHFGVSSRPRLMALFIARPGAG